MKRRIIFRVIPLLLLTLCATVAGVWGSWLYPNDPLPGDVGLSTNITSFKYGLLYITDIRIVGGGYVSASFAKTAETCISADVLLDGVASSSAEVEVTFYNSTGVSYYYDETETVSTDNESVDYSVSGIAQKDEVPAGSYKTVTVEFSYADPAYTSNGALLSELNFRFTVDKDSIGVIVAQTAVGRFAELLNNAESYQTLEDTMNDRANNSFFNKGSAVTYIGNVAGADSGDSSSVKALFGEGFLTMDLDGDGEAEPITLMIKRLDLDSSSATGDSYTYSGRSGDVTVSGAEMTLYITAHDFDGTSSGEDIVVYAACFTKLPDDSDWTEVVPLTKGAADANFYEGYGWGDADSFNTDTWVADNGQDMETLFQNLLNYSN